jgi:hypothetical protein
LVICIKAIVEILLTLSFSSQFCRKVNKNLLNSPCRFKQVQTGKWKDQAGMLLFSEGADVALATQGLSTAKPIACNPLST